MTVHTNGGRSAATKARKALIHGIRFRGCESLLLEGAYSYSARHQDFGGSADALMAEPREEREPACRQAGNAAKEYRIKAFRARF